MPLNFQVAAPCSGTGGEVSRASRHISVRILSYTGKIHRVHKNIPFCFFFHYFYRKINENFNIQQRRADSICL